MFRRMTVKVETTTMVFLLKTNFSCASCLLFVFRKKCEQSGKGYGKEDYILPVEDSDPKNEVILALSEKNQRR